METRREKSKRERRSCRSQEREWAWEPKDQEDFDAIDAAFSLAESLSAKRRRRFDNPPACRLPRWVSPSSDPPLRPCPRNVKARYPTFNFGGRIAYCRTYLEVEKATMELLEMTEAKKKNMDQIFLGLDIEWKPTFRRGEKPRKAAVLQICGSVDCCYVMHIIHSGIPPILQSVLEDSMSIKVGVGIANDALKIMKDYNVCVKDLQDLSNLANIKLGGAPVNWGLGSLVETLTCEQLEKPKRIRLGNWETHILSSDQIQYAATDAFASWYLHQVLRSFPDAAKSPGLEEKVNVAPNGH